MDAESNFSKVAPPVFDGENYDLWAVKMEAYLEALDLWEAIEEDYEVVPLPANPTMAQIKSHKEKKNPESKGKIMPFCWCFINHLHKDHESQISESNLGLFEGGVCWR